MDQEQLKKFVEQHCEYVENVEASADRATHRYDLPRHPIVIVRVLPRPTQCGRCELELSAAPELTVVLCEGGRRVHCSGCRRWIESLRDQPGSRLPRSTRRGRPPKQRTEPDKPKRPPGRPKRQSPQSLPASSPADGVVAVVRDYPECQITEFQHPRADVPHQPCVIQEQHNEQHKC